MPETLQVLDFAVRLFLAALFAAVLGWEREARDKPAGLRTHMLVALGAASVALVAMEIARGDLALVEEARLDPLRVIEGVIGGIGFLGAGSIIQSRGSVEGITTAATIWMAGAIGVACGMGYYTIAILTVFLAWLIVSVLRRVELRFFGH